MKFLGNKYNVVGKIWQFENYRLSIMVTSNDTNFKKLSFVCFVLFDDGNCKIVEKEIKIKNK